ncbi:MAG: hypothetical protein ABEJ22_07235 [Haloferacaceae archaeon]
MTGPPRLFAGDSRRALEGPTEGHYEGQPRHYCLHAWLFAENPEGTFARTNPAVSCPE